MNGFFNINKMKKYFTTLNIFRGFFALMVAFLHMSAWYDSKILNNNLILNSYIFVDFFFVLSGFVITSNYIYKANFKTIDFIKKRLLRVYPLHLITLLIFVLLELAKNYIGSRYINNSTDFNNVYNFIGNLFLANSIYLPTFNNLDYLTWNFPSWSISAEVISYIIFAIILKNILKKWFSSFYYISLFLSILAFLILFSINDNFNYFFTYDFGFLRCIAGFFSGVFAYYIYKKTLETNVFFNKLYIINILEIFSIFVLFTLLNYLKFLVNNYGFIYYIFFPFFILTFSSDRGLISKFLNSLMFLHKLGNISYSVYMNHVLVNLFFNILFIRIIGIPSNYNFILIPFNLIFILIVSNFTYQYIELRFYKKNIN